MRPCLGAAALEAGRAHLRRARWITFLSCALYWLGGSSATAAEELVLELRGYAQEAAQWCWAAGGQSVMQFLAPGLGPALCQCRQAEARSPGVQCCASPDTCVPAHPLNPKCRDLGWPDLRRYGFEFETTCDPLARDHWDRCEGRPLRWEALISELRSGRPVLRAYRRGADDESSVGHMVVVLGYRSAVERGKERRWVLIFDPKRVCRETCGAPAQPCCHRDAWWRPYDEAVSGPGYSHWVDIFRIRRNDEQRPTSGKQDGSR
jgi:hypothetical protein